MKKTINCMVFVVLAAMLILSVSSCGSKDENLVVTTKGQMTITGTDDFVNVRITAHSKDSVFYILTGCKKAFNNEFNNAAGFDTVKILEDSVILDVYNSINGTYRSYEGNHKNVAFTVYGWFNNDSCAVIGSVTVSFENGIGTGVFVPLVK